MDASANPEKSQGSSEAVDASASTTANNDIPTVESPKLVPEQGEHTEPVAAARPAPVTALVIANPRFQSQSSDSAGSAWASSARTKFKTFIGYLPNVHLPKVSPLAATIMLAASVGAVAGSLGTFAVSVGMAPSPSIQAAETRTLKETITNLRADLAGVKTAAEASVKTSTSQLARMAERLDRAEKQQRLAMAAPAPVPPATIPAAPSPTISSSVTASSSDVTGSIPTPRPAPLGFSKDNSRPVITGWVLQNVYDGTAYIQSREGAMEVVVGDALPDGGRVEAIRRLNGRWVVVTTNGLVVMR